VQRSVERIDGVARIQVELKTGIGRVTFAPGRRVAASRLWQAIQESGFTPVRIEIGDEVYTGGP